MYFSTQYNNIISAEEHACCALSRCEHLFSINMQKSAHAAAEVREREREFIKFVLHACFNETRCMRDADIISLM